jgi:uncharacterized protein
MDIVLNTGGWILLSIIIVFSLGLDLVGLFGNWILLATFAILWPLTDFAHFGWIGLLGMLLAALAGEGMELIMAGVGAKRFGSSRGGMAAALVGTLIGAVIGTPWFPVLGTLAGACAGAFAGAALYEIIQNEQQLDKALWTGTGAALGRIGGIIAKFTCGLIILLIAFLAW